MILTRAIRVVKKIPWLRKWVMWVLAKKRPPTSFSEDQLATSLLQTSASVGAIVDELRRNGATTNIALSKSVVTAINRFAYSKPCYGDRRVDRPFAVSDYAKACSKWGKEFLVAQYFNTVDECSVIRELTELNVLKAIADQYLGVDSRMLGVNLWWTFACNPSEEDSNKHAQVFHYDIDDLKFVKFFFYLTDVDANGGPHVFVTGSHLDGAFSRPLLSSPRISDDWVDENFPSSIVSVIGPAGTGLIEDTYLLHKGTVPLTQNRLMLQIEFGVLDLDHQSDVRVIA